MALPGDGAGGCSGSRPLRSSSACRSGAVFARTGSAAVGDGLPSGAVTSPICPRGRLSALVEGGALGVAAIVAAALLTAGCSSSRDATPRKSLDADVGRLVPRHGVVVLKGGSLTAASRIVVDEDAKTVVRASGDQPGGSALGALRNRTSVPLADAVRRRIGTLADEVWKGGRIPAPASTGTVEQRLIIADGDDVFTATLAGSDGGPGKAGDLVRAVTAAAATR